MLVNTQIHAGILEQMRIVTIGFELMKREKLKQVLRHHNYCHFVMVENLCDMSAYYLKKADLIILNTNPSKVRLFLEQQSQILTQRQLPILCLTEALSSMTNFFSCSSPLDVLRKPFHKTIFHLRIQSLLRARYHHKQVSKKNSYLQMLLELQKETVLVTPDEVYQRVLEAAIQAVPGAEAGSLAVKEGDRYFFKAVEGFNLSKLSGVNLGLNNMLSWHGNKQAWLNSQPRILSKADVEFRTHSRESTNSKRLQNDGRLDDIQANLCLPVSYRGNVLATLNLDNFHDPYAFSDLSLEVAKLFGPTIAVLLHNARYRSLLQEAALQDALTGLGNRRAFDQAFEEAFAEARRHDEPLSLLVMDLSGFKKINDALGHDSGDKILVEVAKRLKAEKRVEDRLFRWGGDEFTAILPHATSEGAFLVANRFIKAIESIQLGKHKVSTSIGIASIAKDGETTKALIKVADARMYAAKQQKLTLLPADTNV